MHELSVALSLVEMACEKAGALGDVRVEAVCVRLGPFSGVVKDALLFCFEAAAQGTAIEGARLEIEEVPLTVLCEYCSEARQLVSVQHLRCPVCDHPTPDVISGRELELTALEVADCARIVEVREGILKKNDMLARDLRARFNDSGVFVVSLVSSPGAGKTALLQKTLQGFKESCRVGALVGDLATDRDAQRLAQTGVRVQQITTGTVCHLEAQMVEQALTGWDLGSLDLLFIENVGNLVCPSSYDLGEQVRVVLLSVTEGEDKPLKYPTIFNTADLAVITKIDLADAAEFDREEAHRNIHEVRPGLEILEVSARTGVGLDRWRNRLRELSGGGTVQKSDAMSRQWE